MPDVRFAPFQIQKEFLRDKSRIRCLFAAKRSGKSEPAYIDTIIKCESQENYKYNAVDNYMAAIVAPTNDMLHTLVWPKFNAFAAPFKGDFIKSRGGQFTWNSNNSIIHGVTAEKIKRLEGKKINHIHMTEAFQMSEHVFFECLARLSDTKGTLTIDGSLGTNIPNPKQHWLYKTFKEKQFDGARVWEWYTRDNPYFPKDELERMRRTLDPTTFRQLFEISWSSVAKNAVYSDFNDDNIIRGYVPDPDLETHLAIDWGFAHCAAVLFLQFDYGTNTVYIFDEIVQNKLTIDKLYNAIMTKLKSHRGKIGRVTEYICDIAGDQEREQTGKSNIAYFKERGIYFKKRRTAVQYGIPIVRSFILDGLGRRKLFIDENRCPHTIDGIRRYHYKEKDGVILNENPEKIDDDICDALRYYFVNMHDHSRKTDRFSQSKMW